MKKWLPYLAGLILLAIVILAFSMGSQKTNHVFDPRITLNQRDKIPYGTSAARTLLPDIFRGSHFYIDHSSPGNWEGISTTSYNQAVILFAKDFNADEEEISRIVNFALQGNYVFIIAHSFSYSTIHFFNFTYQDSNLENFGNSNSDSLILKLEQPFFASAHTFAYPGQTFESSFYSLDSAHTSVLGRNKEGFPDFIQFKTGNGRIFIHSAPLAFSNYFILYKNNIEYFQNAFSVLPQQVDKIDWNDYYLTSHESSSNDPGWFRVLLKYPAFKWGLMIAILMMVLYVILGMRRDQRMIPKWKKPVNDSLDFVQTMGRLYYERSDHHNLAQKMSAYFLEHIRTVYKITTAELDEEFVKKLHAKINYPLKELNEIVFFINNLDKTSHVSEQQLTRFHNQLELFYQNT